MIVIVHTDGGSRGNPGPAASAFTIQNSNLEVLHEESKYLGESTNNVAEYTALRMAMEWLSQNQDELGFTKVDIVMDSELVVKQMRGEYKIKDQNLQAVARAIKTLEKEAAFAVNYIHVRRAENARADQLVNQCLDIQ